MERRQLEYFIAVVEHGGFTAAANALHVAQPSLSHAIRSLEREFGGKLFHRLPHGVALTAAGEALVRPAQQVLRDLSTASSLVREVLGLSGGRLDIVSQTTLSVDPLAEMLGRFHRAHPRVSVRVVDPERGPAVAQMVADGQCELGLVDASVTTADLRGIDLPEQEMHVVLPADHPHPAGDTITSRELAALDLIVTPPGTETRAAVDDVCTALGVAPRIAVETAHRAMIVPLVLYGVGAALLPASMARDAALRGARMLSHRPRLLRHGRLVWRSGPLSPAAQAFVDLASAPAQD
ncbi:LysR family transcriptional regulator [Streptomyces sporangiiformans]|uniref:LysR family transcriptional regulator n=1 Tax=Streptomyces sporangiiformans TaxID=2315329 RepID=A0A505D6E4_9ACTN|nr:LysR family transcriptional regulator [Streptomyces sporangiiformans]TPQ17812.1 LysR family transcriptional regulator [Streptomyces sporangiiformans]